MSLINKMLVDLDARAEESRGKTKPRPVLEGLRPVSVETQEFFSGLWFAGILLCMVIVAASSLVWHQWYSDSGDTLTASLPGDEQQMPVELDVQNMAQTRLTALNETTDSVISPFSNRDDSAAPDADQGRTEDEELQSESSLAATAVSMAAEDAELKQTGTADTVSDPGQANHTGIFTVEAAQSAAPAPAPAPAPAKPALQNYSREATALEPLDQDAAKAEKVLRPLSPAESAEDLYRSALNALRARQTDIAVERLKQALALFPQHIAARESLAELLLQQGHWYEAQQVLHDGVTMAPEHYRFVFLLARVYVEQGNDIQALALLESNRGHGATDADYIGLLATLYQRSGRHDKAEESFMQALSLRPNEGRWWLGLGISCEALQKWPQARDAYVRVRSAQLNSQLVDYADQRLAIVMQHLG